MICYNNDSNDRLKERDRRKIKEAKSNATELLKNLNKYNLKSSTISKESYDVYSTTDGRNVNGYFNDIEYTCEYLTNEFHKKSRVMKFALSIYVEYYNTVDNETVYIGFHSPNQIVKTMNQFI